MQTIKLYLSYFLLICMLAMGGFGLASYFEAKRLSHELSVLDEKHAALAKANTVNQETIADLKSLRENDHAVLQDFTTALSRHDMTSAEVRNKIIKLEKTNAEIAALLDTIIPGGSDACLLDNSCSSGSQDRKGETAQQPPTTLR